MYTFQFVPEAQFLSPVFLAGSDSRNEFLPVEIFLDRLAHGRVDGLEGQVARSLGGLEVVEPPRLVQHGISLLALQFLEFGLRILAWRQS